MPDDNFHISGQIINHHTRQGLPDLCIKTRDKDLRLDGPPGQTVRGREGFFDIQVLVVDEAK
jgi:hypothetical protein